jgi:integrase
MLGAWNGLAGYPDESALVFAGSTGAHLWPMTILRRELYPAMVAAEIDRFGPTGVKRTFHSFRHCLAALAAVAAPAFAPFAKCHACDHQCCQRVGPPPAERCVGP